MKCRNCKECNGFVCRGEIPGVGGKGTGLTFIRNVEKLKEIKINLNVVSEAKDISTITNLFNKEVSLPVYCAPIAGINMNYGVDMDETTYTKATVQACANKGTIAFTGDGKNLNMFVEPIDVIDEWDGVGIVTMKPWVKEGIDLRIAALKGKKVFALATDIDSAGLALLRSSEIPVETKSEEAVKELKASLDIPLIVKGIMTKEAAIACVNAKVDGIVISNHGGRVLDQGLATIEVLEEIVSVCKGKLTILIDGGFRSGIDVFKALALGADGVLIGRPFALQACLAGQKGVEAYIDNIQAELKDVMLMSGAHSIEDITRDKVSIVK